MNINKLLEQKTNKHVSVTDRKGMLQEMQKCITEFGYDEDSFNNLVILKPKHNMYVYYYKC